MTTDASKTENSQIARDNWYRFREAYDAHEEYARTAKKCSDFYAGKQWDEADKARLEAEGRPCLTLNMVLSTVNAMIGEQLERKVDVNFTAGKRGTEQTAYALNKVSRAIFRANHYDDVEEQVFADGLIVDRGYFDIRMEFEKNIQGEITINAEDPIDVILEPGAKEYEPHTWNEVFVSRWMTVDSIETEFGKEAADKVLKCAAYGEALARENFEYYSRTYGKNPSRSDSSDSDEETRKLRRVRVIERQHYKLCECLYMVDLETGDMRPTPFGTTEEEIKALAKEHGFGWIKKKARRVRITTSVDDVLLDDDWSIYRSFTIVPYFPYFRRGMPFGVVRNLLDPQNLLNKTSSQELHIVNTTANSGWVIEEDSLVDMDAEDLEKRGAETGLVLTFKRNHQPPDKIQPNQIPTGIDRISQKAAQTIREVSSINASMLGTARADQSGRAQEASISRGQVQVSVVLNNLKRARRMVALKVLELVQDFYTETRYFKVAADDLFTPEAEPTETMAINEPQDDGSILNDVTIGDYGVDIGFLPGGGNMQMVQMEEAIRLREMGVQIPDHVMVSYSQLHQRGELQEFLKNSQGFGEPTPEQQQLQEVQVQHQIEMLQRELSAADAEIELKESQALAAAAKAQSLQGYNQMQVEVQKLRDARQAKQQDLALRVALAARSHQSQQNLNESRIAGQIGMKAMDMLSNERQSEKQASMSMASPTKPKKEAKKK